MSPDARNSLIAWGAVLTMVATVSLVSWSGIVDAMPGWLIWVALPVMFVIECVALFRRRLEASRGPD